MIYETNLNQAYQAGIWERTQRSNIITHYLYRIGPSQRHRETHLSWDGLVLPKTDSFWNTHFPINGWNCKCTARGITQNTLERYRKDGIPDLREIEEGGSTRKKKPIKETKPKITYDSFVNKRTGQILQVPNGVNPAFATNSGRDGRSAALTSNAYSQAQTAFKTAKGRNENLKSIFEGAPTKAYARTFVNDALTPIVKDGVRQQKSGKLLSVGFLQNKEFSFLEKKGLNPNGVIAIKEETIAQKVLKERERTKSAINLTKEEYADLPNILNDAEEVYWDKVKENLVYMKNTEEENQVIRIIVQPSFSVGLGSTKLPHESVRTAFKVVKKDAIIGNELEKIR